MPARDQPSAPFSLFMYPSISLNRPGMGWRGVISSPTLAWKGLAVVYLGSAMPAPVRTRTGRQLIEGSGRVVAIGW